MQVETRKGISTEILLIALVIGSVAGSGVGYASGLRSPRGEPCDYKACDVTYGYCFDTDIRSNCSGLEPCHSTQCETLPTKECEGEVCDTQYAVCVPGDLNSECSEYVEGGQNKCSSHLCTQ